MSWYARNGAWLARFDPELFAEVQQAKVDDISIIETRRGSQTLLFREVSVHSKVDPEREARKLCAGEPCDVHIHFGFGLGYLVKADQAAGKTLVLEPQPGFLAVAMQCLDLTTILADREVALCVGLTRFRERLAQFWQPQASVKWIVSPFHEQAYPRLLRTLKQIVAERQLRDRNVKQTVAELMPRITQSSLRSVVYASRSPSVAALQKGLQDKPAVLVSPGPSLEAVLPWLRFAQGRVVLIAGARSVKVLDRAGIRPDVLIHNEARPFVELLHDVTNLSQTFAVLADQCHVSMYRYFAGRTFVYRHPMNGVSRWMGTAFEVLKHEPLLTGGSVATEALSLAVHMGCNPIVLVGQDLCLRHGKRYVGRDLKDAAVTQPMAGVWQQAVQVPNDYLSFVFWFRDTALRLRKKHASLALYNASQGVQLHGFDAVDLRHIVVGVKSNLSVASMVQSMHEPSAVDDAALLAWLQEACVTCEEVLRLCHHFERLSSAIRTAVVVAKLEQELYQLREKLPFLDGLTSHLQPLLEQTKGDQFSIAPTFFAAYREAADIALRQLREALAEQYAAHPA